MANENQFTVQALGAYIEELVRQFDSAVTSVAVNADGTGYVAEDVVTIDGGDGTATIRVDTVTSGAITTFTLLSGGAQYVNATGATVTGGSGADATFDVTVNPVDDAELETALETFDTASAQANLRKLQVLRQFLRSNSIAGGKVASVAISDGGTGYSVGDVLPVAGTTGGTGGAVIVTSVSAGVIDGVAVHNAGGNYSGVISVDTTGIGGEDAVITAVATVESEKIVKDVISNLGG